MNYRPIRIAVGGLMHESNTFARTSTGLEAFRSTSWSEGADLVATWSAAHHEVGGFLEGVGRQGFEAIPTLMAWATPSGNVEDEVVDVVTDRILELTRDAEVDGLLLALHGAMVSRSYHDADGEVLRRLRDGIGESFPIVATLDFHANISPLMVAKADALIAYQTYPHVDQRSIGLKAARILGRMVLEEIRPTMGLSKPPLIVNLLGQETDREPMQELMAEIQVIEERSEVWSMSLAAGFPYADVPEMGPAIVALSESEEDKPQALAETIGARLWELRESLDVDCPDAQAAVDQVVTWTTGPSPPDRPIILVDLGDNIGGGTPGDGTVLFEELVRRRVAGAWATLCDPEAVERAQRSGVGGQVVGPVGGRGGDDYGAHVMVEGVVRSLHEGMWIEPEPRHGGLRQHDQGPTAVIDLPGPITLIVNTRRTPPFSLGQLTSLGLDPSKARAIVVKAAVAYKAAYAPLDPIVVEVDTPGITRLRPECSSYRNIERPLFPWSRL